MKTIQFDLPVFVFFDTEGNVISYRHQECEDLLLPINEFADTVRAFNPSIPNSHTTQPNAYHIPITLKVDENDCVVAVYLDSVENIYGKTHEDLVLLNQSKISY